MEQPSLLVSIVIAVVAASGFWRLLEVLLTLKRKQKLDRAQTNTLLVDANTQVTENWMVWSAKMEARVQQLECKNEELLGIISKQKTKTLELERQISVLKSKNSELKGITTRQKGRITELEKQVEKLEVINANLNKKK